MVSSQSPPRIHSPFGVFLARSPIRLANSSALVASFNCTASSCEPPLTKCTCASLKPGSNSFPAASITWVLAPRQLSISAFEPTDTMRSPRTATAWAVGWAVSTVQTLALMMTRSAAGLDCAEAPIPRSKQVRRKMVFIFFLSSFSRASLVVFLARWVIAVPTSAWCAERRKTSLGHAAV